MFFALDPLLQRAAAVAAAAAAAAAAALLAARPSSTAAAAALHVTAAVVGVGVLGLPRAVADLGWAGGMAALGAASLEDLRAGKGPQFVYRIINKGRLETYTFKRVGEQKLDTALGKLDTVRIGEVQVFGVEAVVTPQSMPYVLLGNSFLADFQMTKINDQMVLEKNL